MKKLFVLLFIAIPLYASSLTTRMGLTKPDDGETGWGTTLRNNYDVVDSSVAILSSTQTFSGANTFSGASTFSGSSTLNGNTTLGTLSASQFVQTDSNKKLVSYDLLNVSNSFSGTNTFSSSSNSPAVSASNNTSGTFANSVRASKIGGSGASIFSTVDVSTAASFDASSSGTAALFRSGSGNAIQVDKGNILLNPLTASQFVKTDASKNLVSYDLIGGTQTLTGTNTFNNNNNTFTGTMTFPGAGAASFKNSSNNATSQIFNNGTSGQDTMEFTASKGFAFGPSSTISGSNFAIVSPAGNTYEMTVGTSTTSGVQDFAVTQTGITQPTIFQVPSKTKAQLNALAPSTAGLIYYCSDCSTDGVVVSTGTGTGAFGRISARTTAIN